MKENSKNLLKDIDDIFSQEPSVNQKAWGIINDFYHFILSNMENQGISKADLAKRLGRSRSAISQMFNKNPNLTIRKMVEIADSVGLDITIIPTALKQEIGKKNKEQYRVIFVNTGSYEREVITSRKTFLVSNSYSSMSSKSFNVSMYRIKAFCN